MFVFYFELPTKRLQFWTPEVTGTLLGVFDLVTDLGKGQNGG